VPEQVSPPSFVGQAAAALQEDVSGAVVQLGAVPPVMGISAQQTSPGQSVGVMQSPVPPLLLPLPPPLLLPELLPELLPLLLPELLPLLLPLLLPELLPLLLPELLPLLLPELLPLLLPDPPPELLLPVPVEPVPLQPPVKPAATKTADRATSATRWVMVFPRPIPYHAEPPTAAHESLAGERGGGA
jgi:hypothetical protein